MSFFAQRCELLLLMGVAAGGWLLLPGQEAATIRVPVRLVSLPVLVFSAKGALVAGLEQGDFRVYDNSNPQTFRFEADAPALSVVVAVQTSQSVRAYLPVIAKVGSMLDNSLKGQDGESALLGYEDDVRLLKPFDGSDLGAALHKISAGGEKARLLDAAAQGIDLLKGRPSLRSKILVLIGQPFDSGSNADVRALMESAARENVSIFALTLPLFGKNLVGDSFTLNGLGSQWYKGGYIATVELTKMGPTLRRSAKKQSGADPFTVLTGGTGGMQMNFRKQAELENSIIALGAALRTRYTLSYTPTPANAGDHSILVAVDKAGMTVRSRSGYRLDLH